MWLFPCNILLGSEVVLCAVKVQNAVIQIEQVNQLGQAGFSSINRDFWLQFIQRSLSTMPPLINQCLEMSQIILWEKDGRTCCEKLPALV